MSEKSSSVNLKYIDVFSGCGGLALGLHNAGLSLTILKN